MIKLQELLGQLALQRPLFHSEADFQYALAWELHNHLPEARVRLELPMEQFDRKRYLDIYLSHDDRDLALELKYKTRTLAVTTREERFELKNQGARDHGRYDFIKDIWRLEQLVRVRSGVVGYAVLLTNDNLYWKKPNGATTVDRDFRLHDGQQLSGTLQWIGAGAGTMQDREDALQLHGDYLLNWQDYSQLSAASYGRFRYLLVEVAD